MKIYRGANIRVIQEKIELKGMHLNHNFFVVVGKQCRTENAYGGVTSTKSLNELNNVFFNIYLF